MASHATAATFFHDSTSGFGQFSEAVNMARPGRKPRALAAARLRPGNERLPAPPSHITGEASIAWVDVVRRLSEAGNLKRADPVLIEEYATFVALFRQARETVEREGLLVTGGHGSTHQHPACEVMNSAALRLRGLIHDLCLSPASAKGAPDPSEAGQDHWGGLFDGRG
jgi:P27 family predicted phage terminase small subunit